jgi:CRISPR system Cascade subunit CasC
MKNKVFVDFHIIQTVPPSCVNRDDTNSPKTAVYGGAVRARVSSQAWKKATRDRFKEKGVRTKNLVDMVAEKLDGDAKNAQKILEAAKLAIKAKKESKDEKEALQTGALFFISDRQAEALAELARAGDFDKNNAQKALKDNPTIDIALFGRMVADDPNLNIDAACQVAHAISTHKAETEFDFFTAIDDRSPREHAGAGMMGTVEFNSATLYRYATVAAHDLKSQLGGAEQAADAVKEFADAFVRSMPTGKQNTFANGTLPDHVLVTIRRDQPVNLVGAFEKAVKSADGYVEKSIAALNGHAEEVYRKYSGEPQKSFVVGAELPLPRLLESLREAVRDDLAD